MMTAPEDTVVGDLRADDAADNATAVHSHSQLQSGARLMLHNASVKVLHQMLSVSILPPPMLFVHLAAWGDHLYLKGEYLGEQVEGHHGNFHRVQVSVGHWDP